MTFFQFPSLSLFLDISRLSVARSLQHHLIKSLTFDGPILDIGGGELASYRHFIGDSDYTSLNIDPHIKPSLLISPDDDVYPFKSALFNHCLLFNLLEHLESWDLVLNESYRALSTSGKLHILVPFIYPVHPCPFDFVRPTDEFLRRSLKAAGFSQILVKPVSPGPFSMAYMFFMYIPILHPFIKLISFFCDLVFRFFLPNKFQRYAVHSPLFYYVVATK